MNAVEIEQAITDLAEQPFDPAEFPYAFLEAFGNKATTIKRLRAGASNKSDLGGVLQTSNIHILTCDAVPRFSKIARSYLLHVGGLDWTKINPDIFGSMIQAVAEDEERGELGMHYTSVPNILKVLNPLFLDDLRAKLAEAGDNLRTLLNLRRRIARIRVFDPACGSGNFSEIDFENEGGEMYICGNPPYNGSQTQTKEQKADLANVFEPHGTSAKHLDYVCGWFMKAAEYGRTTKAVAAFVSTNSICSFPRRTSLLGNARNLSAI
jgi:hypothetical protein